MSKFDFDLTIIGSGPGGYVAAIRAAQLNKKVLVVEKNELGGICLNWGCIPTKALLRSSEILSHIKNSKLYGIEANNSFSLEKMINRSRKVSKKLSTGIEFLFKKNSITLKKGTAYIKDKQLIEIINDNKKEQIKTDKIIIATGAKPRILSFFKDLKNEVWDYKKAMLPDCLPKKLGIIGSGAIGLEFASFYNALGAKVEVFELQDRIAPNEDHDISNALEKSMSDRGVIFHKKTDVVKLIKDNNFELTGLCKSESKKFTFDRILVAVGVIGNTENLGLENTKIITKNNQIVTHDYNKTDEPNIFAIGDVAGIPWLAHKASHEGISCVEYLFNNKKNNKHHNNTLIPSCIYTNPQVASIGITENQAKILNKTIKVGLFPLSANGKALALGESEGFIKTIFESKTGEILGAHMIGTEVTELINTFSLAIKLEATEEDIINTIFPHPTLSESIHESVLDAYDRAIHI